jgi:hypothetical protein
MSHELHDTRARLDAMLQELRDEIEQLTGELQKAPNAFREGATMMLGVASTDAT